MFIILYFSLLVVVFLTILVLSHRINNLKNWKVSKDVNYRHSLYLCGEDWARMGATVLCVAYFYCFGCTSWVVYCLENHPSDVNHFTSSHESSYDDKDASKLEALKVEAQKASKILGVPLYIVYVDGYGYMAYDPSSLQAFYGLDGKGVLRPHFNLYNAFLNVEGKLERHPTSNEPLPPVSSGGKNIFQCAWKWMGFGSTELVESHVGLTPQKPQVCSEPAVKPTSSPVSEKPVVLPETFLFFMTEEEKRNYLAEFSDDDMLQAFERSLAVYEVEINTSYNNPVSYNEGENMSSYTTETVSKPNISNLEKMVVYLNTGIANNDSSVIELASDDGFIKELNRSVKSCFINGHEDLAHRVYETCEKLESIRNESQ